MEAQITYTGMYVGQTRKRRIVSEVRVERELQGVNGTELIVLEAKSEPLTLAKSKSWSYRTVDVLRSQVNDLVQKVSAHG